MDRNEMISQITQIEWDMFGKVQNEGGRASCQDDHKTFEIMRAAQFEAWGEAPLCSYLEDLAAATAQGRNLVSEKYAYMMESTAPESYRAIAHLLPEAGEEKKALIDEIMKIHMDQTEAFATRFPKLAARARPVHREGDEYFTSIETYERGELRTYSEKTLGLYLEYLREKRSQGESVTETIMENTARAYGYTSAQELEERL